MTHLIHLRKLRNLALVGGLGLVVAAPVALADHGQGAPAVSPGEAGDDRARPHRGHRGRRHAARVRALELTADQREALRAIRADVREERAAIRGAYAPGSDEARAARRALRASTRDAVREVLTAEQIEKLRTLRKARGERGEARGHRHGPRRGAKLVR